MYPVISEAELLTFICGGEIKGEHIAEVSGVERAIALHTE